MYNKPAPQQGQSKTRENVLQGHFTGHVYTVHVHVPNKLDSHLVDQFNNNQLQYITKSVDLINACAQVFQSSFLHSK